MESNVTGEDQFFAGEDKILSYEIFAAGSTTLMENVSSFDLRWELRRWGPNGASVVVKTSGNGIAVAGVYNADRALNTQRVVVSLADTDTDALAAGRYACALKRMDDGLEAILSHGQVDLLVSAVRQ
jgi:hypothetical protein